MKTQQPRTGITPIPFDMLELVAGGSGYMAGGSVQTDRSGYMAGGTVQTSAADRSGYMAGGT
jgi:hypothetical protein